jgi:hypothetical protein
MTRLPALDASHRAADRDREPHHQLAVPCGDSFLRCGGLLIPGYTASLERDVTGTLVTLWRCFNCGDCIVCCVYENYGS